jgi:hypothetical protein
LVRHPCGRRCLGEAARGLTRRRTSGPILFGLLEELLGFKTGTAGGLGLPEGHHDVFAHATSSGIINGGLIA